MIKRELIVDKVGLDIDEGSNTRRLEMKGRIVKVLNISELDNEFMTHKFDNNTLRVMFWAQFRLNYCGG